MNKLKSTNDIDDTTELGRLLLMSLAKISTESQTDKTPDEILSQIYVLYDHVYPLMEH